jgi:hypothetical protein
LIEQVAEKLISSVADVVNEIQIVNEIKIVERITCLKGYKLTGGIC